MAMSFACPHLMLLSPDMLIWRMEASGCYMANTSSFSWKYLAVIVVPWYHPSTTKYIVQAVNTGSDVSSGQFDILLGAGGFGICDACSF